ncbi:unnamed protein product [Symbiodinium natans]|uniref:Uncharacterized protein n=1 Tax=Symbiodinium natans TaxID=878477 RepID=A0A812PUV5_9DINO|nr:unnamed protein product [Symbiodinium natans]
MDEMSSCHAAASHDQDPTEPTAAQPSSGEAPADTRPEEDQLLADARASAKDAKDEQLAVDDVSSSQKTPKPLSFVLDALEEESKDQYNQMVARICQSQDPGKEAVDRLRAAAVAAWQAACVKQMQPDMDAADTMALQRILAQGPVAEPLLEAFHDQWSRKVYDEDAVGRSLDLRHKPQSMTLKEYMKSVSQEFYSDLLDDRASIDPLQMQRETPLTQVAAVEVAHALARLSAGHGLPPDGHVVHAQFQGLSKYLWNGPLQHAKLTKAIPQSESEWDIANAKLAQLIIGESASGKDNAKSLLATWMKDLRGQAPVMSREALLEQGNITISGIFNRLKAADSNLQVVNPELEKVLQGRKRDVYLQDSQMIELLDGTATGKANGNEDTVLTANAWASLGSQLKVYVSQLAGDACARFRFSPSFIDDHAVADTAFEEKLLPRRCSQALAVSVLKAILAAQHRVAPPEQSSKGSAEEDPIRLRQPKRKRDFLVESFFLSLYI